MNSISSRVTRFCLQMNLIDDDQAEWCIYSVQTFLINSSGFLFLMVIGILLAPWPQVLVLNLGVAFLRSKAGGLHMPTPLSCFLVSLLFEAGSLLALPFISLKTAICLLALSVGVLWSTGPCNNQSIHCSDDELIIMKCELKKRLSMFVIVTLVLFILTPFVANAMVTAAAVVSVSVALSKAGLGIQ